ncbi:MSCRAMM family protein [Rhodoplanes sp. Z2-YC6860]|uniref:MSCRAMM family protein n=1 Tax=Rhodoplanes sp. Z2-YC6860 TaxID=674703 RepID=UPI00078DBE0B|nr:SdrD B-like domain-containing protein [Rhodoplanes sp. Z2-YC6860]AMN43730.1 Cna B domain-containing protein [Rhodoplanes sp. Z2-YC6860]
MATDTDPNTTNNIIPNSTIQPTLVVSTDQTDYAPQSTATITAQGVTPGATVEFLVTDTNPADGVTSGTDQPWTVTDGGAGDLNGAVDGTIVTSWSVNQDAANQAFVLTATDQTSGQTATASFTDSPPVTVDVSGQGATGTVNGAIFTNTSSALSTGTGVFDSFLLIQKQGTEQGFNTDGSPLPLDDKQSQHTNALQLSSIPLVHDDGTPYLAGDTGPAYREFRLDLNEKSSAPQISLDKLQIYQGDSGNLLTLPGTAVYDLDQGQDHSVLMSAAWDAGSGKGDYVVLIPDSVFNPAHPFVYLYSQFSGADSGFEEWGVISAAKPQIAIDKVTVDGSVSGDGISVHAGDAISWVYTVTNPGNVSLSNITVTDNIQGAVTSFTGDDNNNGMLDPTETWTFTETGVAGSSNYSNIGTVTGTYNGSQVMASDPSSYVIGGANGTATISGSKLIDLDGVVTNSEVQGVQGDSGVTEYFAPGWTIYIEKDGIPGLSAGDVSTVTDQNGDFSFTGLSDGTYAIHEVLPAGWTQLAPGTGEYDVTITNGQSQSGIDFINFQNITISGTKYIDANGDGSTDGDAVYTAGVVIDLFKNGGVNPVASVTTDVNGHYSFTNLGPGTYTVAEVTPTGWTETLSPGGTIMASSGHDVTGEDFANFQNITISGTKYIDANGDGSTNGDVVYTAGVLIDLFKDGGANPVASVTTGTDGTYSFTNLGPGTYTVAEVTPTGWTETLSPTGTITASSGHNVTGEDFANFQNITISGTKYIDANGDGSTNGDVVYTAGVLIDLFKDGGANPVASVTTGTDGTYSFTNLGPGTYTVAEVTPSGWTETLSPTGTITASSGHNVTGEDFANFQNITISGTKYIDANGDGSTVGDVVYTGGVLIDLFKNGGANPVASVTTDVNGHYSFSNLGPGTYTVTEVTPTGWTETLSPTGTITASSGHNVTGEDFANFKNFSISGYKWDDADVDGKWDTGEKGIANWTIYLNNGTSIVSATTDASGHYTFSNLGPGSYTVTEAHPSGWFNSYNGTTTVVGASGVNVSGDSGDTEVLNFGNHQFIKGVVGLTQGFWSQHKEAWDGTADTTWANIVDKAGGLFGNEFTDAGNNVSVTQGKGGKYTGNDDIINKIGATHFLLGDANGNGIADPGENAQGRSITQVVTDFGNTSQGNEVTILLNQLDAAQLNIYNGAHDPGSYNFGNPISPAGHDLVGEGVKFLQGLFSGAVQNTATSTNLSSWTSHDPSVAFDTHQTRGPGGTEIYASGQDLKNVLQAFNQGQIVTSNDNTLVGWSTDQGITVTGVHANTPDAFWLVAWEHGVIA